MDNIPFVPFISNPLRLEPIKNTAAFSQKPFFQYSGSVVVAVGYHDEVGYSSIPIVSEVNYVPPNMNDEINRTLEASNTQLKGQDMATEDEYIKAATLENEIEARLLDSVLNERHIPHRLRSYHDTAYDGLFQAQKGWGFVSAPASHRKEVLEILSELRKG